MNQNNALADMVPAWQRLESFQIGNFRGFPISKTHPREISRSTRYSPSRCYYLVSIFGHASRTVL